MAKEISRFFDSVQGDRIYNAAQFAEYFNEFLTSGVKNQANCLKVTADSTGMHVNVDYGFALIKGYAYWLTDDNEGKQKIDINPVVALPRIDRIVLRLDITLPVRMITVQLKKGEEAVVPTPAVLEREGNIYELSIALINVAPNIGAIRQENITDHRGDASVCGYINSLITFDTTEMQKEFDDFMETIKSLSPILREEIVDSLVSADATKALSAKQGKVLNEKIQALIDGEEHVYAVYA